MASSFRITPRNDKFLPNVIQTAYNQTQPAFTGSLMFDQKKYNQTPKPEAGNVIDAPKDSNFV